MRPTRSACRDGSAASRRGRPEAGASQAAQRTRARVVAAHDAARHVQPPVVRNRRPDGDHVAERGGRRGRAHVAALERAEAGFEIHLAVLAEVRARLSVLGVEGDQARVVGRGQHPHRAGGARRSARVLPERDAAAHEAVAPAFDARVESPAFAPAFGIDREHAVEGRAEEQRAAAQHGRRLEGGGLGAGRVPVARAKAPRDREVAHVRGRDVGQRRVARAAGVAAPVAPPRSPSDWARPNGPGEGARPKRPNRRERGEGRGEKCRPGDGSHAGARCHGSRGSRRSTIGWPRSICHAGEFESLVHTRPSASKSSSRV
jgi:hypothetical protein